MKKLLIWVVVLSISIVTAFSFAGYKEVAAAPEKVTLRYMTWEDAEWQRFTEEFIEKYMEQNPNVIIQYEPTAGTEYEMKLKTSLAAGNAPDVVWIDGLGQWPLEKLFEPIDDYIEKFNFNIAGQNKELLSTATFNDKLYGLFGWTGILVMFYNKNLFDEAGLQYPQEGWTWDDCKDMARKLTKGEGVDKVYGINLGLEHINLIEPVIWGNGARFIDDNLNYDGVMNSDKAVEAIKWYTSFVKEGLAPETLSMRAMGGQGEMFKDGKIAMIWNSSTFILTVKEHYKDFDIDDLGVVLFPVSKDKVGDKPAVKIAHTNPICITKDSKNKDEAFKFIAARVGIEIQEDFVSRGWALPANVELAYKMQQQLDEEPLLELFLDQLINRDKYEYPKPVSNFSPVYSKMNEHLVNAVNEIVVEDKDPKKALDDAVAKIKKN